MAHPVLFNHDIESLTFTARFSAIESIGDKNKNNFISNSYYSINIKFNCLKSGS